MFSMRVRKVMSHSSRRASLKITSDSIADREENKRMVISIQVLTMIYRAEETSEEGEAACARAAVENSTEDKGGDIEVISHDPNSKHPNQL